MKKAFGKKINFNELMNIIELNERKHNVKKVFEWVNNELNDRYLSEWKEKKCGEYIRCANGTFNDKKLTVATWSIKAKILQNDDLKYCKHCHNTIASISHILLGCPVIKKNQISKHDYVCKQIYKHILITQFNEFDAIDFNILHKCINNDEMVITYNKDLLVSDNSFHDKRPDIYYQNMKEKKGYIIDVAICQDNNLELNYIHKINKYKELQEKLRNNREIIYVEIIPIILSINGLIHKESARRLKTLKLQLEFPKILRTIIIKNMKDLMFYTFNSGSTLEEEQSNASMLEMNSNTPIEHNEETEINTSQYS
ncbi:hypothetical protein, conserved [Entamoeba histolytica]